MAKKRVKRKKSVGTWSTAFFFLFLVLSVAAAVALLAPPPGILEKTGSAISGFLGLISVFVPVFLFLFGAFVFRLDFAAEWLRKTAAVFVMVFFFATMFSLVLGLIKPELISFAGGRLAAGTVLALRGFVGAFVAWVVLFSLFMLSLVVFTGWDIAGDVNSLLARRRAGSSARKPVFGGNETAVESSDRQPETPQRNPWVQNEVEKIPEIFFSAGESSAAVTENQEEDFPATHSVSLAAPEPVEKKPEKPTVKRQPSVVLHAQKSDQSHEKPVVAAKPEPVGDFVAGDQYELPGPEFLSLPAEGERRVQSKAEINERGALLVAKLADFGVKCELADSFAGPVLTRYELVPGIGVKVNKILNLADDLALALSARRIRILAPIPGKGTVGIEVPNRNPEMVYLREIIPHIKNETIPVALGKDLEGKPFIVDLAKMPHLLLAGATGSGKSVCVNTIISTILFTRTPYQVKLAMIDPKMLELSSYKGIPHLWAPVVVETSKARYLLEALVKEMEERYSLLATMGVRSIREFNNKFAPEEYMHYIVVVIDELADLMMVSAKQVEPAIARLAQMARAVGIHLVVATQRPSVDVITGVIKANFPSRIAFNVGSKTDSRTILDMNGAEKLLGKGDMLFVPAASPEPFRVHGSFISTSETKALVNFWKSQPKQPYEYELPEDDQGNIYDQGELDYDDPLLEEVKKAVIAEQRASISMVQRKFRVGYPRAGKIIDMLERLGVIGPNVGSKPRKVLVKPVPEEKPYEAKE